MRVLRCGVGGYGLRQERHKLKAVVGQAGRPRLVIVGYDAHDLLDDYLYPGRTVIDGYMVTKIALADAKRGDRKVYSEDELQARFRKFFEQKPVGVIDRAKDILAQHSVLYDVLRRSKALQGLTAQFGMSDPPVSGGWEPFHSIVGEEVYLRRHHLPLLLMAGL